jgi:hypothetical protein
LTGLQVTLKQTAYKTQLEAIVNTVTGERYRDRLDMNNKDTVNKYFLYAFVVPGGTTAFSVPETYYFYSLSNQFLFSTPLLEQTIGWEGGTFDPLAN